MTYDKELFEGEPQPVEIYMEGCNSILWKAKGELYYDRDVAFERLRINRRCDCGKLTNSPLTKCRDCVFKKKKEEWEALPYGEPTTILYSVLVDDYVNIANIKDLAKENAVTVEGLMLKNTEEVDKPDFLSGIEDRILDYLVDHDYDVVIPDSIYEELEKFSETLPTFCVKTNTRPKLRR